MGNSRLEQVVERVVKTVDSSYAGPIPASLLARQDLEASIVHLADRGTPHRDRIVRTQGQGLAHLWNVNTSLKLATDAPTALINLFYADGALPTEVDPTYVQKTAKPSGMWPSINISLYRGNSQCVIA